MTVAGTSGRSVVGSASAGNVKVVGAREGESAGSETEAEADTLKVTVASGRSVVSSVGMIVAVVGSSVGSCG